MHDFSHISYEPYFNDLVFKFWNLRFDPGYYTPMYYTSFFMIFYPGCNGDTLVHDLHDFAWLLCMIFKYLNHFDYKLFWRVKKSVLWLPKPVRTSFFTGFWCMIAWFAVLFYKFASFAWPFYSFLHVFQRLTQFSYRFWVRSKEIFMYMDLNKMCSRNIMHDFAWFALFFMIFCLDDLPGCLFQFCISFWASFVK